MNRRQTYLERNRKPANGLARRIAGVTPGATMPVDTPYIAPGQELLYANVFNSNSL